jgi:putative tricarboxylic transport membrane protein
MDMLLHALGIVLDPYRFAVLVGGVVIGLVLGVIPGLGGVVGLAILIPFTYGMDPFAALALLIGMHAVTTTSDLIPAILFGVPGTVGAAATVLDGHALAKKGQAGRALGAGYAAALFGGIFGAVLLGLTIPVIRPVVLYLASPELLAFSIFGLSMAAVLSGKMPLKGLAAAALGLMLAMIGFAPQVGTMRWTFDTIYLWEKLPLVPFTLGLFAIPEMIDMAIARGSVARASTQPDFRLTAQWVGLRDAIRNWGLVLRSSWIGTILGTVPGLGSASIDWIVYGQAQRLGKNTENFGRGDIRGVLAPEAANSAKEGGHLIPTIAFGVPAGSAMAVLLSGFLLHGLVPGPEMLTKHLDLTYSIVWSLTLANLIGTAICLSASGLFARLSTVSAGKLVPIVLAFVFISAYQGTASWGDLYSLVLFGALGWVMKYFGWPRPPLMLGFVLGGIFERYFFISTEVYGAAWLLRPVVLVVIAATLWAVYKPIKNSLMDTIAVFRDLDFSGVRVTPNVVFSIGIIVVIAAALWSSRDWPYAAKLVPLTATYAALLFAVLNLVTEIFSKPRKVVPSADSEHHVHSDEYDGIPLPTVRSRALHIVAWLVGFLIGSYLIGLLPALFFFVLLQSRFEFGERWRTAAISATATTFVIWFSFSKIFAIAWPQALIGDLLPALRDATMLI